MRLEESPSARKVWIEMTAYINSCTNVTSPSARKVWIEILTLVKVAYPLPSPSARKVWIEIFAYLLDLLLLVVTFREEGVD